MRAQAETGPVSGWNNSPALPAVTAPQAGALPQKQVQPESRVLQLPEALGQAYLYNPDLQSARAELRSVDETYAQALSGYRPRLTGEASYISSYQDGDRRDLHGDPKQLLLELRQPLYRGGATTANVKFSGNTINAQRALLHVTEQSVLLDGVAAYMDVLRDNEILALNVNNEGVLGGRLDEALKRFELGDITKTDVSQSESRLSNATASRVLAEGNLRASRARFEQVIGLTPERLVKPAVPAGLPATLDEALAIAEQANPNIVFTKYSAAAAHNNTRSIRSELMPQLEAIGTLGRTYDPANNVNDEIDAVSLGVVATMPFYTGGLSDARVREARHVEAQRQTEVRGAVRAVRQSVIDAWAALTSAQAEMEARRFQINAAELALQGVKIEADYGSRTTLDLLDAEQEYLDAKVAYVIAERGHVVAAYRLLAALGSLTADALALPVERYDHLKNFQKSKDKWIGTSVD